MLLRSGQRLELADLLDQLGVHGAQLLDVRLPEVLVKALVLRHVADRRSRDALFGLKRTEPDLDRKLDPILAPACQLEPRVQRARGRLGEERRAVPGMAVAVAIRNQHLGMTTNQLLAFVAEQLLGRGVHLLDVPVCVDDHHRVGSRLEHRPGVGLRSLKLRRQPDPVGDVARHHQEADRRPVLVAPRRHHDASGELRSVLVDPLDRTLPLPIRERLLHHRLRQAGAHSRLPMQPPPRLTEDLGRSIAIQPPSALVPQHDPALGVSRNYRVLRGCLEDIPEEPDRLLGHLKTGNITTMHSHDQRPAPHLAARRRDPLNATTDTQPVNETAFRSEPWSCFLTC